jgi:outer membrane protein OmpA-like peptidoglycan-associated protein
MLGIKSSRRKSSKEEAEKPFWISFSDLMTALMVLFLVAMAVALMAVTQTNRPQEFVGPPAPAVRPPPPPPIPPDLKGKARDASIKACIEGVEEVTKLPEFSGVKMHGSSIDFGPLVRFQNGLHTFETQEQAKTIRKFVPKVLELAQNKTCEPWLKRVVVEGFASQTGTYLFNLNLSYLRSQRVLCELLSSTAPDALSPKDRNLIQTLFLVGASSFNTAAGDEAAMRRVELKLEFRDLNAKAEPRSAMPLDPGLNCPNDVNK